MPYKLSATLTAHSTDVRALAAPTPNLVISGSRDKTAIAWIRSEGSDKKLWDPTAVYKASGGFVGSVAYLPPTDTAPKGYALAGGQDAIINVYNIASGSSEPEHALIGHTQNVCALAASPDGTIISGSWDSTAKVWKDYQLVLDLKGHSAAVWAVLPLPDNRYLTGSADKTIKLWEGDRVVRTYEGHTDVVRGVALITDIGFASCSNSGDIIIWTMEGDLVHTLSAHTSFVYALDVLPNGDIVSSGEDRTVRVWHDFDNTQVIVHPAISVWTVVCMPNGDIVTGCSDGVVRIFSEASERWASQEDLKEYDEKVASQARPSHEVQNMKTSDPSVLEQPGSKPGQTVMVKNVQSGTIEAHQWDASAFQWQKIGDVVDAPSSGNRQMYEGKEYDYVFDIDVQEGTPALKLPYNTSENPFHTAQRFLERHNLPMAYVDQVVDFITRNTQGATLGGAGQYVDPYTGASRYQASASSVPTGGSYQDPYTGASRYSGGGGPGSTPSGAGQFSDPYTGGGAHRSGTSAPAPAPRPQILPVRTHIPFKTANVPRMQDKINEFSERFRGDPSTSQLAIESKEKRRLDDLAIFLTAAVEGRSTNNVVQPGSVHVDAITSVLSRWPLEQRWPLIDLGRLVAGLAPTAFSMTPRGAFVASLARAADWSGPWSGITPQRATNIGLVLRAASNAMIGGSGADATEVLAVLDPVPYINLNKASRLVYATLLFNYSVVGLVSPLEPSSRNTHVKLVNEVLTKEPERQPEEAADKVADPETVYRALIALGNFLVSAKGRGAKLAATEVQVVQARLISAGQVADPRIATAIQDIKLLLQ